MLSEILGSHCTKVLYAGKAVDFGLFQPSNGEISHIQSYIDTGKTLKSPSLLESLCVWVAALLLGILTDSLLLGKLRVSMIAHIFSLKYLWFEMPLCPARDLGKREELLNLTHNKMSNWRGCTINTHYFFSYFIAQNQ